MANAKLIKGDCIKALRKMPDASAHACVTDSPYELGFMGKKWDSSGIAYSVELWREVLRVLKPGGRLLAFGGTRTHHRMTCAIEDAQFIIEDCVMWLFGQGFPKHESKLKPAYEPIIVARKGRVSRLNIDECRIGADTAAVRERAASTDLGIVNDDGWQPKAVSQRSYPNGATGRWPANVILGCACEEGHDEGCAVRLLDEQSGTLKSNGQAKPYRRGTNNVYGKFDPNAVAQPRQTNSGGASRFFYCAKASRRERSESNNNHPTVKPVSLMRYLCRLITPTGGTVLDPFTGSGTTGVACAIEGFSFIGIEREAEYVKVARRRIKATTLNNSEV